MENMENIDRFYRFLDEVSKDTDIKIAFKDESKLMKAISFILFFNKLFMTFYITTIGNTIYYPSRDWLERNPIEGLLVLSHEYVHIMDNKRFGKILYPLMYLFPQILAIFSLFTVIAFFNPAGWYFLLFLVFLAPIPSIGRKYIELRGYKMSIYALYLLFKERGYTGDLLLDRVSANSNNFNSFFVNASYYFMWPFGVQKELDNFTNELMSGNIPEGKKYRVIEAAFEKSK